MTVVPNIRLNSGAEMPQLGFGVFQITPEEVADAVSEALRSGYRLIDTAAGYANEEGVGRAIRESGIPRDELFVTTKLTNSEHGRDRARRAFDASLSRLGLDYVDLYLIHWPVPGKDLYAETWKTFGDLVRDGKTRSIGVSNFTEAHIGRLLDETGTVPAVNQVELHPRFSQAGLREYHRRHGIATEAWAPIGQGKGLLSDPDVVKIAESYGRSAAQVVLRWHIQLGNVAIPKSVRPARIRENIQIFDFDLDQRDIDHLSALNCGARLGPDPDAFNRD